MKKIFMTGFVVVALILLVPGMSAAEDERLVSRGVFSWNGERPYFPSSWEWRFIKAAQREGATPMFWCLNRQPEGWLKVKVDYFDEDTGLCYTVWCKRYLPCQRLALQAVREAGFIACNGIRVCDGGRYQTLLAGRVINWPVEIIYD